MIGLPQSYLNMVGIRCWFMVLDKLDNQIISLFQPNSTSYLRETGHEYRPKRGDAL